MIVKQNGKQQMHSQQNITYSGLNSSPTLIKPMESVQAANFSAPSQKSQVKNFLPLKATLNASKQHQIYSQSLSHNDSVKSQINVPPQEWHDQLLQNANTARGGSQMHQIPQLHQSGSTPALKYSSSYLSQVIQQSNVLEERASGNNFGFQDYQQIGQISPNTQNMTVSVHLNNLPSNSGEHKKDTFKPSNKQSNQELQTVQQLLEMNSHNQNREQMNFGVNDFQIMNLFQTPMRPQRLNQNTQSKNTNIQEALSKGTNQTAKSLKTSLEKNRLRKEMERTSMIEEVKGDSNRSSLVLSGGSWRMRGQISSQKVQSLRKRAGRNEGKLLRKTNEEADQSVDRTIELPQNYQIVKCSEELKDVEVEIVQDKTQDEDDCDLLEVDESHAFHNVIQKRRQTLEARLTYPQQDDSENQYDETSKSANSSMKSTFVRSFHQHFQLNSISHLQQKANQKLTTKLQTNQTNKQQINANLLIEEQQESNIKAMGESRNRDSQETVQDMQNSKSMSVDEQINLLSNKKPFLLNKEYTDGIPQIQSLGSPFSQAHSNADNLNRVNISLKERKVSEAQNNLQSSSPTESTFHQARKSQPENTPTNHFLFSNFQNFQNINHFANAKLQQAQNLLGFITGNQRLSQQNSQLLSNHIQVNEPQILNSNFINFKDSYPRPLNAVQNQLKSADERNHQQSINREIEQRIPTESSDDDKRRSSELRHRKTMSQFNNHNEYEGTPQGASIYCNTHYSASHQLLTEQSQKNGFSVLRTTKSQKQLSTFQKMNQLQNQSEMIGRQAEQNFKEQQDAFEVILSKQQTTTNPQSEICSTPDQRYSPKQTSQILYQEYLTEKRQVNSHKPKTNLSSGILPLNGVRENQQQVTKSIKGSKVSNGQFDRKKQQIQNGRKVMGLVGEYDYSGNQQTMSHRQNQPSRDNNCSNNSTIIISNNLQLPNFTGQASKMQDFVTFSQNFKRSLVQGAGSQKSLTFRYQGKTVSNPSSSEQNQNLNLHSISQSSNQRKTLNPREGSKYLNSTSEVHSNKIFSEGNSPRFNEFKDQIIDNYISSFHQTPNQFRQQVFSDRNSLHSSVNLSLYQGESIKQAVSAANRKSSIHRSSQVLDKENSNLPFRNMVDKQNKLSHFQSESESQRTADHKNDIERQQNLIIQRFMRGEITMEQAQRLDDKLIKQKVLSSSREKCLRDSMDMLDSNARSNIIDSFNQRMQNSVKARQRQLSSSSENLEDQKSRQTLNKNSSHTKSNKGIYESFTRTNQPRESEECHPEKRTNVDSIKVQSQKQFQRGYGPQPALSQGGITNSVDFETFINRQNVYAEKSREERRKMSDLIQKQEMIALSQIDNLPSSSSTKSGSRKKKSKFKASKKQKSIQQSPITVKKNLTNSINPLDLDAQTNDLRLVNQNQEIKDLNIVNITLERKICNNFDQSKSIEKSRDSDINKSKKIFSCSPAQKTKQMNSSLSTKNLLKESSQMTKSKQFTKTPNKNFKGKAGAIQEANTNPNTARKPPLINTLQSFKNQSPDQHSLIQRMLSPQNSSCKSANKKSTNQIAFSKSSKLSSINCSNPSTNILQSSDSKKQVPNQNSFKLLQSKGKLGEKVISGNTKKDITPFSTNPLSPQRAFSPPLTTASQPSHSQAQTVTSSRQSFPPQSQNHQNLTFSEKIGNTNLQESKMTILNQSKEIPQSSTTEKSSHLISAGTNVSVQKITKPQTQNQTLKNKNPITVDQKGQTQRQFCYQNEIDSFFNRILYKDSPIGKPSTLSQVRSQNHQERHVQFSLDRINTTLNKAQFLELLISMKFLEKTRQSFNKDLVDQILKDINSTKLTLGSIKNFIETLMLEDSKIYQKDHQDRLKKKYQSMIALRNQYEKHLINNPQNQQLDHQLLKAKSIGGQQRSAKNTSSIIKKQSLLNDKSRVKSTSNLHGSAQVYSSTLVQTNKETFFDHQKSQNYMDANKIGRSEKFPKKEDPNVEKLVQISPYSDIKSQKEQAHELEQPEEVSNPSIYAQFEYQERIKQQKIEAQRQIKQIEEAAKWTFKPEIISKPMFNVQSKYKDYSGAKDYSNCNGVGMTTADIEVAQSQNLNPQDLNSVISRGQLVDKQSQNCQNSEEDIEEYNDSVDDLEPSSNYKQIQQQKFQAYQQQLEIEGMTEHTQRSGIVPFDSKKDKKTSNELNSFKLDLTKQKTSKESISNGVEQNLNYQGLYKSKSSERLQSAVSPSKLTKFLTVQSSNDSIPMPQNVVILNGSNVDKCLSSPKSNDEDYVAGEEFEDEADDFINQNHQSQIIQSPVEIVAHEEYDEQEEIRRAQINQQIQRDQDLSPYPGYKMKEFNESISHISERTEENFGTGNSSNVNSINPQAQTTPISNSNTMVKQLQNSPIKSFAQTYKPQGQLRSNDQRIQNSDSSSSQFQKPPLAPSFNQAQNIKEQQLSPACKEYGLPSPRQMIEANNHSLFPQPQPEASQIQPLLHVDVKHGPDNEVTRLSIFDGDNVPRVVLQFSVKYGLAIEVRERLINYVQGQIIQIKRERRAALQRMQQQNEERLIGNEVEQN